MTSFLQNLGAYWLGIIERLGRATLFMWHMIGALGSLFQRPGLLITQLRASGVMTLSIVLVSGLFVGMVLALQAFNTLKDFGQEERIGTLVALTLVRELGPVVTGLLFAGRAGSAMTAEIGLMKATEQLSGLEMMAVDPFKRVFAPRFLAGFLSLPMLAAMFSAVMMSATVWLRAWYLDSSSAGSLFLKVRIVFLPQKG